MGKSIKIKKPFKKVVVVAFNELSSFAKPKVTKLKLKVKDKSTTSFFALAKKLASKAFSSIVVFFDFNANFAISDDEFFDSDANDETSIDATIVTKISLNKEDELIIDEIASRRERRLSNERFEAI